MPRGNPLPQRIDLRDRGSNGEVVYDFAGVLSPDTFRRIDSALKDLERTSGIEGAVVTVKSISDFRTDDPTLESFATHLFNAWGIGHKKENDGFLIVVSIDERRARIELGDGWGTSYNQAMRKIMDRTMVPAFAQGDFDRGLLAGTAAVTDELTDEVSWLYHHRYRILMGIAAAIAFLAAISMFLHGKTGWGFALLAASFGLVVGIFTTSSKSSSGFGGGSSSGSGGASGGW